MDYEDFVNVYEELSQTTKRLDKTSILAEFLITLKVRGKAEWIYLLNGRVVPDFDNRELGVSEQTVIKAIAQSYGINENIVVDKFNKIGDLGKIAEELSSKKKQSSLFSSRLSVDKVCGNLIKLMDIEGKGTVGKKIGLISELLGSAKEKEAKYIVRTVLSDLKIGVSIPTIIDSIKLAFFEGNEDVGKKIQEAYDLCNDLALVFNASIKGLKEIEKIGLEPGRPVNVMLAVKAESIEEAFRICGKPAAIEHKYDGFRMVVSKNKNEVKLFTRKLEEVTKQFPDIVNYIKKYVDGETFILDSEVVGYDPKTKKYMPFEAISQRIRRKYDIEDLMKKLPVEVNVFDILFYNGKSLMDKPFIERREIIDNIISTQAYKIRPAIQFITDDENKATNFYLDALKKGEEGIMVKKLNAPYQQGRKVGYLVKMKPDIKDLDLVIVKAEYGTGKRGGWLTSYTVACNSDGQFLEVGKVSSGLKEKEEEGTTYDEITKLLKNLIISTKGNEVVVKPKIIVSVTYQNIQKSPSYSSGYALRFPRITQYRPDRKNDDVATFNDIKKEYDKNLR